MRDQLRLNNKHFNIIIIQDLVSSENKNLIVLDSSTDDVAVVAADILNQVFILPVIKNYSWLRDP